MLSNPDSQYRIERRRRHEAEEYARVQRELSEAGMTTSARGTSAALLRWLADRVDPGAQPASPGPQHEYHPNA